MRQDRPHLVTVLKLFIQQEDEHSDQEQEDLPHGAGDNGPAVGHEVVVPEGDTQSQKSVHCNEDCILNSVDCTNTDAANLAGG